MTAEKILCFFFAGGKTKALEKSRETGVFQRRAVGKGGGGRDRKATQEKGKRYKYMEKDDIFCKKHRKMEENSGRVLCITDIRLIVFWYI